MYEYHFKFWETVDVIVYACNRKQAEEAAMNAAGGQEDDNIMLISVKEIILPKEF